MRYRLQVTRRHGNVVDAFTTALLQGLRFVGLATGYICLQTGPLYLVQASGEEETTQLVEGVTCHLLPVVIYVRYAVAAADLCGNYSSP